MGLTISCVLASVFFQRQMRIVMFGLDAAGKTTILYRLKVGEIVTAIPTIGFNVEAVQYKNISLTLWDVGGGDKMRTLWRHYLQDTQGLIFVIDSNDRERIDQVQESFQNLCSDAGLWNGMVLILANKQDLPNSMTIAEITDKLALKDLRKPWHIQGTCYTDGQALWEGVDWLTTGSLPAVNLYGDTLSKLRLTISLLHIPTFFKKEMKICMLGLDSAGKTTILYKLIMGLALENIPTFGYNVETLEQKNTLFTIWDVGGQDKIRPLWRHYLHDTHGLIFVVDSNDRERVDLAQEVLHNLLSQEDLRDTKIMILANKQDLPNSMTTTELTDKLGLENIRQQWNIQAASVVEDQGLRESFDWFLADQRVTVLDRIYALAHRLRLSR